MQRAYEVMYIFRPQLDDEQLEAGFKKVEDFITQQGGSIVRHEKKGKKRLAYEVKDQRDGHYALLNFTLDPEGILEFKRFFMLSEEVIRYLILRQEEAGPVLPKPVAMAVAGASSPPETPSSSSEPSPGEAGE